MMDPKMVRKPPRHRTGYLQKAVRRAFWAHRAQVLRTSDFMPWCFPGQPAGSYRAAHRWNVRRAVGALRSRLGPRELLAVDLRRLGGSRRTIPSANRP